MSDLNYEYNVAAHFQTWDETLALLSYHEEVKLEHRIDSHKEESKQEFKYLYRYLDSFTSDNFEFVLKYKHPQQVVILHHWWKLGLLNPIQIARLPIQVFLLK